MDNNLWDEYLNGAVAQIRDKKIRAEVREELLDHLEDRKERFLRFNMSEEEAQREAVEIMGSRDELAEELGRLHSFSPVDVFRSVINCLCFGILCAMTPFQTLVWKFIVAPIGVICIFYAMLRLKDVSLRMGRAFTMACVYTVYKFIMYGIMASEYWAHDYFFLICSVIDYLLLIIFIGILLSAFTQLLGKGGSKIENKLIERDAASTDGIIVLMVIYVIIAYFTLPFFILIQTAIMGAVIHQLLVLRSHLEILDRCPDVKKVGAKKGIITAVCIVLSVAVPLATSAVVSTPKVTATQYVINDMKEAEDLSETRAKMIEKGFPEFIVNDLPDSEVANYKNLKNLSVNKYDYPAKASASGNIPLEIYVFGAETDSDMELRSLLYFRWKEQTGGFRDSVYVDSADAWARKNDNNFSYKLLYDENGKTYSYNAINEIKEISGTEGIEYRVVNKKNLRGYIAYDLYSRYSLRKSFFNITYRYQHQNNILNYPYSNRAVYKEKYEDFERFLFTTGGERMSQYYAGVPINFRESKK